PCACLPAVLPFCWPLCLPSCCFAVLLAPVPAFLLFCRSAGPCVCLLAVLLVVLRVSWSTGRQPAACLFVCLCLVFFCCWLHCRLADLCRFHFLCWPVFSVAQFSVFVVHADILLINALSFFSFIYIV
ncbi:hypothetical protein, partial [Thiolapillus sp.]|uniref:hypothetical protein n=1 Tax=Thiolapillus sp. TaxID=2017437 RepID=UPI003AF74892